MRGARPVAVCPSQPLEISISTVWGNCRSSLWPINGRYNGPFAIPLTLRSCFVPIVSVIAHQGFAVSTDDDIRQVLEICKGDYKDALRMALIANAFYEAEIAMLKNEASAGYGRGLVRKPVKRSK